MFETLPSLQDFSANWFAGGPTKTYLPLIYDLVALTKPALVVTLGYAEGQVHFTCCQAAKEAGLPTRCVALPRDVPVGEDEEWSRGIAHGKGTYGNSSELRSEQWSDFQPKEPIDLLFIDEIDSGAELAPILAHFEPLMARDGLILFHGLALERADAPMRAWENWTADRHVARFDAGIGLGVASAGSKDEPARAGEWLFTNPPAQLALFYRLAAERAEAEHLAGKFGREVASLTARQVWLDTILAERREAQRILDEQQRILAELQPRVEAWQRDRESLQRDRANWIDLAQHYEAERDKYKALAREQKELIKLARQACRKRGRCFLLPHELEERRQRSISERVLREIKRVPQNLLGRKRSAGANGKPAAQPKAAPLTERDRYAAWIAEHEPDKAALEAQRRENATRADQPKISLLLLVFDPPPAFLEALLASVKAQTYENWELCVVDAGSKNAEVLTILQSPQLNADSRIKMQRLPTNLGIAENTNRALELATGEFFACIDHDDLLAPFALHAIAAALRDHPQADVIYSDEDRLGEDGERHAPFFKPEWSPELLCSFMYLGHLTVYRRSLVGAVGGFRKEFDLSQDYDFALRATERARDIRHVPQVLYHWREHAASGSMGGKPEARNSNLAALGDAMRRRNLPAEIIEYPAANRARLTITRWPRVSIIISTDSPERGEICAVTLPQKTNYPDLEIVIVTNSDLAQKLERVVAPGANVRLVRYDKPFNFSDKSNVGAAASSGERLIFFNDDVLPNDAGWVQELIEQLENPEIGAVAPKMLYESGKIQHAGLVTGVRGLVGTACHQWPGDSADYSNFAQSLRDVSALSAACLAMRRDDFFRVGEFDAVNTPIAHSDLDLCFKVRAAGLRCVYTPFVTMTHLGHASIGAVEQEQKTKAPDKASVFLLKRWAGYTCHDPYYPTNIRDWLYQDSPTPIRMSGENDPAPPPAELDLLFVTHDLSWSGAPLILLHVAEWGRAHGFFTTVMSPVDGPLRAKFHEAGIPMMVDPLVFKEHASFRELAREFDCVVASTIFGAPVVRAAKAAGIPHLWWIHEGKVAEPYLTADRGKRTALEMANMVVAPDTASSQIYQPYTSKRVRILNYGIPDPQQLLAPPAPRDDRRVRFLLLGTIEERKGQRVFLEALRQLRENVFREAQFEIIGRSHDAAITDEIEEAVRRFPQLSYQDSVTHAEALVAIQNCDVMVSASWDETGPLILMEALALGRPILSTQVGAVAEHLASRGSGLFFKPGDSAALAVAISRLVEEPEFRQEMQAKAREDYERLFTFERFAEGFADLVREAAALHETAPPMAAPALR